MDWVLKHSRAEGTDRWILFLIAYRANPDNENCCWPSISKIAVDSGLSPRTVVRSIKSLLASGELVGERRFDAKGHRKTNLYHLAAFSKDESLSANLSPKDESLSANLPRDKMPRDILSPRIVIESNKTKETPHPEQEKPCRVCGETGVHTCRRPVLKQGRDRRPKYPKRTEEFPSSQYREPVSVAAPVWDPHGFSAFWQAYPLKMSQDRAFEAWNEMRPPIEEVLANLARWKASSRWRKDGGEYIPYPRKFLLEKLWKSNPEPEIERALTAREEREKRNAETIARVRAKDTHPKAAGRVRELLQARSD